MNGIPAGCVSSRIAGKHGEMGDHGIDAYSHNSPLHKSARSNLDPRGHEKLAGCQNPRACIDRAGKPQRAAACSGLPGQAAGSSYPGHEESPYAHAMTPRDMVTSEAPSPSTARSRDAKLASSRSTPNMRSSRSAAVVEPCSMLPWEGGHTGSLTARSLASSVSEASDMRKEFQPSSRASGSPKSTMSTNRRTQQGGTMWIDERTR